MWDYLIFHFHVNISNVKHTQRYRLLVISNISSKYDVIQMYYMVHHIDGLRSLLSYCIMQITTFLIRLNIKTYRVFYIYWNCHVVYSPTLSSIFLHNMIRQSFSLFKMIIRIIFNTLNFRQIANRYWLISNSSPYAWLVL